MPKFTIILTQKGRLAWQAKSDGLVRSFTRKTTQCLIKAVHNNQKTNSKSLETVKRNSNEILKQVQDDCSAKASNNYDTTRVVTKPNFRNDLVSQSLNHLITSRKPAFTLAEVLITLAVIGIVAALTIPALIQEHKKRTTLTAIQKFRSTVQQAIMLSEIDNGPISTWPVNTVPRNEDGSLIYSQDAEICEEFFLKYLAPYMKYDKFVKGEDLDEPLPNGYKGTFSKIYLNNGSYVVIHTCGGFDFDIDINGDKGPNKNGRDIFCFILAFSESKALSAFGNAKEHFGTYFESWKGRNNRETVKQACANPDTAYYCARLLEMDGWEFKEDYPYKL